MQKRTHLLLAMLAMCNIAFCQNVGIGTTTPAEKLDVSGNINVTGTIKANGTDGTANQVLMKNNAGKLSWGDVSSYKNFQGFGFTDTWVVPAGVTKVLAEVWGGGGGGHANGGGGAGGYGMALIPVVPGSTMNITVGSGGSFGTGSGVAGNGGTSIVSASVGTNNFSVDGGSGATASFPGFGGQTYGYLSTTTFIFFPGEPGDANTESYVQSGATTFLRSVQYGRGGNAPAIPGPNAGRGARALINDALGGATVSYQYPSQGLQYGGGGGGGKDNGMTGGYGYVILRW